MFAKAAVAVGSVLALAAIARWSLVSAPENAQVPAWVEVAPDLFRSTGPVGGYALGAGDHVLVVDCPVPKSSFEDWRQVDQAILTHPHRPAVQGVGSFLAARIPVRAPSQARDWLSPEGVRQYWKDSLPLRGSRTAYLVAPVGFEGIRADLKPGDVFEWRGWSVQAIDAGGTSRGQLAYLASKKGGPRVLFAGGSYAAPGKIFAPYTTDWDHWTDLGLKPTAETLRRLADLNADLICPTYGPVAKGKEQIRAALLETAEAIGEIGFLRSFERFTKQRLGNPPQYAFLAKEQAESNGSKPWTKVSPHLYLTGNTYVLVSKDDACLMMDPWGIRSVDQWAKLRKEQNLGPIEVVLFSHAHFDHYDGVYDLPNRETFQTWTLEQVAPPLADPFRWRAPFLDARPVKIDRRPKDGDEWTWREYRLRFRYLPGQSEYTMGVETTIDGKRCFFTADNFYHQDMFSGSGGWMGLNRSFPPYYADSAQKVLDSAPDWVLAEHGGPFVFDAEDFRRRVRWGRESAKAADRVCLSGAHLHDWNPHHVHVEPLISKAKPGEERSLTLVAENRLGVKVRWQATLDGRGVVPDRTIELETAPGRTERRPFALRTPASLNPGRHVFALRVLQDGALDGSDAFFAVDVE